MMSIDTDRITIEENKRLSHSVLWQYQRDYFEQQGVNAWSSQVPFYVTSNPYIANCYAQLAISCMRDWCQQHAGAMDHPFYLLELGTGPGRFSFYVVKKLVELREDLGLKDLKFVYVMSDFTQSNIDFWLKQPAIKSFYDQGIIDFAIYNMEQDNDITLHQRETVLNAETLVNPLIVFANYIFDTISHDCFRAANGKLQEALVTLTSDNANYADEKLNAHEDLDTSYTTRDISGDNYYNDRHLNEVLFSYKDKLKDSYFLYPIATLLALKKLFKISNNRLFLLSSDKSYSILEELDFHDVPGISFHGSFSLMVNYHAIGEFFKSYGGDCYTQFPRRGIKTMLFTLGMKVDESPEIRRAAKQYIQEVSPADYFVLHRRVSENYTDYEAHTLAAHLSFSDWDPHIFQKLCRRICEQIDETDDMTIRYLAENMPKIANNFYFMPEAHDTLFDIALFYHSIKSYSRARDYYEKSLHYFGEHFGLLYNLALCQYNDDDWMASLTSFRRALELDPESTDTQEWIDFLEKERATGR